MSDSSSLDIEADGGGEVDGWGGGDIIMSWEGVMVPSLDTGLTSLSLLMVMMTLLSLLVISPSLVRDTS